MKQDWVPLRPLDLTKLETLMDDWIKRKEQGVGLCLVCGETIQSEADLIPGTSLHSCRTNLLLCTAPNDGD